MEDLDLDRDWYNEDLTPCETEDLHDQDTAVESEDDEDTDCEDEDQDQEPANVDDEYGYNPYTGGFDDDLC